MGSFDNNRVRKEEAKKSDDSRREKLAGYFFDLSKLIFAGIVIGGLTPMFSSSANEISWETIVIWKPCPYMCNKPNTNKLQIFQKSFEYL